MNRGYTRFEKARIIGARALQISMGAPTLLNLDQAEALGPVDMAIEEFEKEVIPITVIREEEQ
ncbi:MAG: DNA-directed RNA polymerase subunit K [Candidatus Thermoplasmatota archaeon]